MSDVPTIGVLFLLNSLGAGVVAVVLATRLRVIGALAGAALSGGALISIALAMTSGLFGYTEPTFRVAVVLAIVAEVAAVLTLAAWLLARRRDRPAAR